MATMTIAQYSDLLDPRFREIWDGLFAEEPDKVPEFYRVETPTQLTERGSAITPLAVIGQFTGTLDYYQPVQGYDWSTLAAIEYAGGMLIERLLFEFEQFGAIEKSFSLLGRSALQRRQIIAASVFTNAFVVDPGYTHTEGVAWCSSSHTTPVAGVSTTTGFSNYGASALSPTALKSAYITFRRMKDNAGQPIDSHEADTLVVPPELRDTASEIFLTGAGLQSAEGTTNVLRNRYKVVDWNRLTDTNNWFLVNDSLQKENNIWFEKTKPEYSRIEEFDTINAKQRVYFSCGRARTDWRHGFGSLVS